MSVRVDGRTKLTYEEYKDFPDDGLRHEIIDGEHYVSPSPTNPHQSASRHIQFPLFQGIELEGRGLVIDAPMDLELGETDVVQPDLIVVLSERRDIVLRNRLRGVPDLVVEILSPSTSERDQGLKRALYEQYRIPEYWVVDAEDRRVDRYTLTGDRYGEPEAHREAISFAGVEVDLKAVWLRV